MKRTVECAFSLGDKVRVIELNRPGRVTGIIIDDIGVQYRVAYWESSRRESVWMFADEIEVQS